MNKYKVILVIFISLFIEHSIASSLLDKSTQLITVTSSDPNSIQAQLQRYNRYDAKQNWQAVGKPINVVVGRHGMVEARDKKEGDLRTPTGVYTIKQAFGFAARPDFPLKLSYLPLTDKTICVDDANSPYYNLIINSGKVSKSTWKSGEPMRHKVPDYTWGLVINYNTSPIKPGAGSCIFMHVWKSSTTGTTGCIAMKENEITEILKWLDPNKKPLIEIRIAR